jgi:hypothetical protein
LEYQKSPEITLEAFNYAMSIGCKTEVALGGKNTSFILDKSWI